jgi:hypothetical protein
MPDLETPTAPPSPQLSPVQLGAPPAPPTRPPPAVPKRTLRANQSKCGVCNQRVELNPKAKAVIHFNKCWNYLRDKAKQAGRQQSRKALEDVKGEEIIVKGAPDKTEESSTRIPPYSPDLPETACLLCHEDLSDMKDLDAFYHRVTCLTSLSPARCPVCELSFTEVPELCDDPLSCKNTGWEVHTMIWHLNACQNDCHSCPEAQGNWTDFISRYAGRSEVAQRVFWNTIGERKEWDTRQHRASVKGKKDLGLARQDGIYRMKSSPLLSFQKILPARESQHGSNIEVTTVEKEVVSDKIPFDRFKRSRYSVMKLPRSAKMRTDYQPTRLITEIPPVFDSKTFWSQLSYKAQTRLPPKPGPKPLIVASPIKKLTVDGAAAEDFPVTSDKDKVPSQPRLLRSPPEVLSPMTTIAEPDALRKVPQWCSTSKDRDELDDLRKKPLGLLNVPKMVSKSTIENPVPPPPAIATKRLPDGSSTSTRLPAKLLSSNTARPYESHTHAIPSWDNETGSHSAVIPSPILGMGNASDAWTTAALVMPLRVTPTYPIPSRLLSEMFRNLGELDEGMEIDAYVYGRRGASPAILQSSIHTVIDRALTAEEQMARNRECCRGMFGSFSEDRDDI